MLAKKLRENIVLSPKSLSADLSCSKVESEVDTGVTLFISILRRPKPQVGMTAQTSKSSDEKRPTLSVLVKVLSPLPNVSMYEVGNIVPELNPPVLFCPLSCKSFPAPKTGPHDGLQYIALASSLHSKSTGGSPWGLSTVKRKQPGA